MSKSCFRSMETANGIVNYSSEEDEYYPFYRMDETEKSLLYLVLSGNSESKVIVDLLGVKDFESITNQSIFRAAKQLYSRGEPVDLLSIHTELGDTQRPDGGEWSSILINILEVALPIDSTNIEFHVNNLKREARLRKLSKLTYRLYQMAKRGDSRSAQVLLNRLATVQILDKSTKGLTPIPAADLPDVQPPDALWGGFIYPDCITQLNAEPGAGKSTLLYNIAAFGALDIPFLEIPFPKPIKTLYIDLETPEWLRRQKIESICGELPRDLHFLNDLNIGRDLNALIRLCKAEKYDLVIFDTQSRAFSMNDENDNAEANRIVTMLSRLISQTGVSIVLIHHTRKADSSRNGVYRGRGASAIAGTVDIVVNLEVASNDILRLKVEKNRIPGVFQSISMRKLGEDKFERVDVEEINAGHELHKSQIMILGLFAKGGEWKTGEIVKHGMAEGFSDRTIKRALYGLKQSGKVEKLNRGLYRLRFVDHDENPVELE